MSGKPGRGGAAGGASSSVSSKLPDFEDEYDYGYLARPKPRRSLVRAASLTVLSALTVLVTVLVLSFGKPASTSGGMHLISVSVVHRHGARSPINKQTWEAADGWPMGMGELTVLGMQQAYHLGQLLRDRYVSLLQFLPKNTASARDAVKVRSTDMDRTKETAMAALMGLFDDDVAKLPTDQPEDCPCRPTHGEPYRRTSSPECIAECMGLTNSLLAQSIPEVGVAPVEADKLLRQQYVCDGWRPRAEDTELWRKTTQVYWKALQDATDFLRNETLCHYVRGDNPNWGIQCGTLPLTMHDLKDLYSNLVADETAGKPCPTETGSGCRALLSSLHPVNEFLWNYDYDDANAVEAGGMLMGEILENMKEARKFHSQTKRSKGSKLEKPPLMYMYSAHDNNIAALLGTMKAPWFHYPRYTSYLALELWAPSHDLDNEDLWMVNVRYDGRTLKQLPGCEHGSCRFKDFYYKMFWTQTRYPEDCKPWDE